MTPGSRRLAMIAIAAIVAIVVAAAAFRMDAQQPAGDSAVPNLRDPARVAAGKRLYEAHCADCHGINLEGQPNWKQRLPNGRLPAPPHDDTGHTWHHPNRQLFELTKYGLRPPNVSADYQSDMPAFEGTLGDDEIWNVLAYIQSRWSDRVRKLHAELDARK